MGRFLRVPHAATIFSKSSTVATPVKSAFSGTATPAASRATPSSVYMRESKPSSAKRAAGCT